MNLRALIISLVVLPGPAFAFTFGSVVQQGCHERITRAATAKARWPGGALPPAPTVESAALTAAVPFDAAGADAWTLAMMLGVRDVDLRGAVPSDMPELAAIHNSMALQDQHCLREADDDGSEGDVRALASCRAFILAEVSVALGESDELDLAATELVAVGLWHAHQQVPLSRFAFHLGRGAHALQDSFSHGVRAKKQVQTLFNYVEPRLSSYAPARDGHAHQGTWDDCVDDEAQPRVSGATDATAALLGALSEPGTKAQRLERASLALDEWLGAAPGCDGDNGWCADAVAAPKGCSSVGVPFALALLGFFLRRRRSDEQDGGVTNGASLRRLLLWSSGLAAVLLATPSLAAEEPVRRAEVHATAGVSFDRGAGAFGLGTSFALSPRFSLGVDLEAGPWFDVLTGRVGAGTLRLYATLSFTWVNLGDVSLRSAVEAGGSMLLFDVPGARLGSMGIVLGASVLKLSWRITPRVTLEVIPDVLLDVPSLSGVPLVYKEYRLLSRVGFSF